MICEEYRNLWDNYNIKLKEIIDFYQSYVIRRDIDSSKSIGVVKS